jgi:hypothetical protein
MKKRVKFLTAIAGLADPDCAALDKKYEQLTEQARQVAEKRRREFKPLDVKLAIDHFKNVDRYFDVCRGLKQDFSYKAGDEGLIPDDIAVKWEEAGICTILKDEKKAA